MNTMNAVQDATARDVAEGVEVRQSGDALWVRLPRLVSPHHQLTVIWRLHEIWSTTPDETKRVILDVTALEELPVPLENVLLALEHGLRCRGCELQLVGERSVQVRNLIEKPVTGPGGSPQSCAADAQKPRRGSGSAGKGNGLDRASKKTGREETTMSQTMCKENFEQRLLSYVEMLYGVALKLTRDPRDAERITRITMLQAWHWRDDPDRGHGLKNELLKLLRETFVSRCHVVRSTHSLGVFQVNRCDESVARIPSLERPRVKQAEFAAAL